MPWREVLFDRIYPATAHKELKVKVMEKLISHSRISHISACGTDRNLTRSIFMFGFMGIPTS
jgi:hypothetical protein